MKRERPPFNYIFFGSFLFFVLLISLSQLLSLSGGTFSFPLLFLVDVFLQSFLEVLIIIFLSSLISTYFPRSFRSCFIALATLILFFHVIDFVLVRLIDFTIWFALDFVMEDQIKNMLELLNASNVPLFGWAAVFLGIGMFIFLGLFFFKKSEILSQKKEISFTLPMQGVAICTLLLTLVIWDYSTRPFFSFAQAQKYEKALPFKFTFFAKSCPTLKLSAPLAPPPSETLTSTIRPKKRPDIYLFIVESLRDDFITEKITPHLSVFKKQNTSFDLALSGANGTNISWFSLLCSQLPFHWGQPPKDGSPALRLFKEMGYEIHVSTSSELGYYETDEILFGKKQCLTSSYLSVPHTNKHPAWVSDTLVIKQLQNDLISRTTSAPRLHIIFLDSTHFDYSWPKNQSPSFAPIVTGMNYWKAFFGKTQIEEIKNRYKNALAHIDTLFGQFQTTLQSSERGKESIVVFTGDHAEEFCEKGFLFHGSHLSREQTHIPLYYAFGKDHKLTKKTELTSHLDIFPTLFHALTDKEPPKDLFQGASIFSENRWPYVVTARYNAGRVPYEFFIHNGKEKLLMQFASRSNIPACQELKVLEMTTENDKKIDASTAQIKELFDDALLKLFPTR